MPNPTRDTTAGRVYNDLRNLARRNGRSTDEVMVDYLLERFLFRMAVSPLGGEHFVLKGGLLLAQFGAYCHPPAGGLGLDQAQGMIDDLAKVTNRAMRFTAAPVIEQHPDDP